ncbi:hypothetical protein AGIG_G25386 [Arapaima gigas]
MRRTEPKGSRRPCRTSSALCRGETGPIADSYEMPMTFAFQLLFNGSICSRRHADTTVPPRPTAVLLHIVPPSPATAVFEFLLPFTVAAVAPRRARKKPVRLEREASGFETGAGLALTASGTHSAEYLLYVILRSALHNASWEFRTGAPPQPRGGANGNSGP